jgi:hypothetical protein
MRSGICGFLILNFSTPVFNNAFIWNEVEKKSAVGSNDENYFHESLNLFVFPHETIFM